MVGTLAAVTDSRCADVEPAYGAVMEAQEKPICSPGFLGYVAAVAIAVVVVALALAAWTATSPASSAPRSFSATVSGFAALLLVVTGYVSLFALPMALVGVPIVHWLCYQIANQAVHVMAAIGTSVVFTLALTGALSPNAPGSSSWGADTWALAGLVGVAVGLGRASVIPLVHRRARRRG